VNVDGYTVRVTQLWNNPANHFVEHSGVDFYETTSAHLVKRIANDAFKWEMPTGNGCTVTMSAEDQTMTIMLINQPRYNQEELLALTTSFRDRIKKVAEAVERLTTAPDSPDKHLMRIQDKQSHADV
jgi:hypothetical protein